MHLEQEISERYGGIILKRGLIFFPDSMNIHHARMPDGTERNLHPEICKLLKTSSSKWYCGVGDKGYYYFDNNLHPNWDPDQIERELDQSIFS